MPPVTSPPLTFDVLVRLEPTLRGIEQNVRAKAAELRRNRRRCALNAWYRGGTASFDERLMRLVGFDRHESMKTPHEAILRSHAAYQTAFRHLFDMLPDCRHNNSCSY